MNTLKYAKRANCINKHVIKNIKQVEVNISQYKEVINELKDEIELLKGKLQRKGVPIEEEKGHIDKNIIEELAARQKSQCEITEALKQMQQLNEDNKMIIKNLQDTILAMKESNNVETIETEMEKLKNNVDMNEVVQAKLNNLIQENILNHGTIKNPQSDSKKSILNSNDSKKQTKLNINDFIRNKDEYTPIKPIRNENVKLLKKSPTRQSMKSTTGPRKNKFANTTTTKKQSNDIKNCNSGSKESQMEKDMNNLITLTLSRVNSNSDKQKSMLLSTSGLPVDNYKDPEIFNSFVSTTKSNNEGEIFLKPKKANARYAKIILPNIRRKQSNDFPISRESKTPKNTKKNEFDLFKRSTSLNTNMASFKARRELARKSNIEHSLEPIKEKLEQMSSQIREELS